MSDSVNYSGANQGKNPNKEKSVNGAPEGPYASLMFDSGSGDSAMVGDTTVSSKGKTFHFK